MRKNAPDNQVRYLGRWVDKSHFRAFVYSHTEEKLANNYEEFQRLVESGLWFAEKPKKTFVKERKKKNGAIS